MFLFGTIPLNVKNVYAWYNTIVKTGTYYVRETPFAKMGTTTQYGYIGPTGERYPAFYSALLASGTNDLIQGCYWPDKVRIEVSGEDPNGDPLSADRFTGLSVLSSPDDSGVEQQILRIVFDVLAKIEPSGLATALKHTITEGGATTGLDIGTGRAWGQWHMGLPARPYDHLERGLRFGYHLNVDPALEGTYTLFIHYSAEIWHTDGEAGWYCVTMSLFDGVFYEYVNTPLAPSKPAGETSGYSDVSYDYSTSTTDPNSDSLKYEFDWDDGSTTTTGWCTSGAPVSVSHSWGSAGNYNVRVRAQDSTGAWSGWSPYLPVSIEESYTLIISASSGGTTIPAPGTYPYDYGSSVTVTAETDSDYNFAYWLLDGAKNYDNPIGVTMDSDHTLKALFYEPYEPGPGYPPVCPTLFVWNGSQYVEEATLDIHADSDVTLQHTIAETLAPDKNSYKLSLRELDNFTSHIDQVKLYAVDSDDGETHEAHLTKAIHSELGDVKEFLLHDDETRVDLTPEQTIDLKFTVPDIDEVAYFIFEINGYNMKTPIDEIPP